MDKLSVSIDSAKQASALRYQAIGLLARREQSRSELQRKLHLRMLEKCWDVDLEYLLDELHRQGLQACNSVRAFSWYVLSPLMVVW